MNDERCTNDADPWFRPEQGDRHATNDEWAAMTVDMPCTCEHTGQATCFRHTGSRLILGAVDVDSILASLPADTKTAGDDPWGGANLASCGNPVCCGWTP